MKTFSPGRFSETRLLFFMALFRMGYFGAAHGWRWWAKRHPFTKICHTYPAMIKLGTVIAYLELTTEMKHVVHPLNSADISIFSSGIVNFCYIKKYRYRLHFNT